MTTATVVGSGPNGLAAALTLAAAGIQVRVVEAADVLGGGVRSSELTVPGVLHDECSGFHPFGPNSAFARAFDLASAGLRWRWADVELAHPLPSGRGAVLSRSFETTAASLGADGARWRRIFEPLAERFDAISEEFLQPMLHLPRHPLSLALFGMPSALPATAAMRLWKGEAARALFAGTAAHAFRPLHAPFSSAIGVALLTAGHAYGWPVAEGGSVSIGDAIVKRAREHDVAFETGRSVTSVRDLDTDIVMLAVAPKHAADIIGQELPSRVARAYRKYRHGPAAFKVDFAVEGGVPWEHQESRRAGTIHLGGTAAEVAAAERDVCRGRMPPRPFVLLGQQYLADPGRSHGDVHPVYAYAHVPSGYTGDATAAIIMRIEEYAPGFRERIVGHRARTVERTERENANYVGGDIVTGMNSAQQLVFRPRPALDPYSTGVPGMYLCSAATPPGAGAHGMCGYLAAQSAIRELSR